MRRAARGRSCSRCPRRPPRAADFSGGRSAPTAARADPGRSPSTFSAGPSRSCSKISLVDGRGARAEPLFDNAIQPGADEQVKRRLASGKKRGDGLLGPLDPVDGVVVGELRLLVENASGQVHDEAKAAEPLLFVEEGFRSGHRLHFNIGYDEACLRSRLRKPWPPPPRPPRGRAARSCSGTGGGS